MIAPTTHSGHGWDIRRHKIPPSLEFIEFVKIPASDPIDGLGLSFKAFGKTWKLDLSLNTFLLSSKSKFDVRNENGEDVVLEITVTFACVIIAATAAASVLEAEAEAVGKIIRFQIGGRDSY